jgi:hypothetical protein
MIVVGTAPFTHYMLLRFVVTGAGPGRERAWTEAFGFVAVMASDTA